jgi:hypothetical protein
VRRVGAVIAASLPLILSACGGSGKDAPAPSGSTGGAPQTTGTSAAAGAEVRFSVPAVRNLDFNSPGFHYPVTVRLKVQGDGRTVALALRDAGRPDQRCTQDHPLGGCVTVDWADDPSRPHVPRSGVFANTVAVSTAKGTELLHLHPAGTLDRRSEPYTPG